MNVDQHIYLKTYTPPEHNIGYVYHMWLQECCTWSFTNWAIIDKTTDISLNTLTFLLTHI